MISLTATAGIGRLLITDLQDGHEKYSWRASTTAAASTKASGSPRGSLMAFMIWTPKNERKPSPSESSICVLSQPRMHSKQNVWPQSVLRQGNQFQCPSIHGQKGEAETYMKGCLNEPRHIEHVVETFICSYSNLSESALHSISSGSHQLKIYHVFDLFQTLGSGSSIEGEMNRMGRRTRSMNATLLHIVVRSRWRLFCDCSSCVG